MIHEVIKKYRMSGILSLTENQYKGHNYKMTAEQEKAVVEFVKEHWIKEHWGIVYSKQGMNDFLNRHGFVYKKPQGIPGKHPSAEEQKAVMDGWIKKGQEKFFKTNTSRAKINVNGAYNPLTQEVIGIEHEENVNQQSNMKLIDKILEKDFKGTEKHKLYLVMDNARYNHGKLFQAHLEKWKKEQGIEIEVLYLPPYSPNLNLIERLWKYAKKKILGVYYDELWKFKSAVKNFFDNTVKDEAYKMELKQFIGTTFQVISS